MRKLLKEEIKGVRLDRFQSSTNDRFEYTAGGHIFLSQVDCSLFDTEIEPVNIRLSATKIYRGSIGTDLEWFFALYRKRPPILSDISFGDKAWQKLDVYPTMADAEIAPVVIFIHGGSWRHGRKDLYFFTADTFLRLVYTVVLPDYVDDSDPSTLRLHSRADQQVGLYNQEKLAASLLATGGDVETIPYNGLSHIEILLHLHPWFSKNFNVAEDIDTFFRKPM